MYGENGERPKKEFWKNDPVHPTPAGYKNLLSGVMKRHQEINFNRSYTAGGEGSSKFNYDLQANRFKPY
jgi:hypothetical protein